MIPGHKLEDVRTVLRDAKMTHIVSDSGSSLLALTITDHSKLTTQINVDEEQELLSAATISPFIIQSEYRGAILEYITRANSLQSFGHFDFDLDEGHLSFVVTAPYEEEGFSDTLLVRTLDTAVTQMEKHLKGIALVLFAGYKPTAALDAVLSFNIEDVLGQANDDMGD